MDAERLRVLAADAAHVAIGGGLRRRRNQRRERRRVARQGNRVAHLARDHLLRLTGRVHVDDRRFAGDRDRLGELAQFHVGVDRGGESRGQDDAVAFEGGEALQREGDFISAWPQIDDAEDALAVGDNSARLLDEHRAAGIDLHARKDGTRAVLDDSGDAALRRGGGRQQEEPQQSDYQRNGSNPGHRNLLAYASRVCRRSASPADVNP